MMIKQRQIVIQYQNVLKNTNSTFLPHPIIFSYHRIFHAFYGNQNQFSSKISPAFSWLYEWRRLQFSEQNSRQVHFIPLCFLPTSTSEMLTVINRESNDKRLTCCVSSRLTYLCLMQTLRNFFRQLEYKLKKIKNLWKKTLKFCM